MIEVTGDLWTFTHQRPIIRCVTTNGMVKRDGTCVMGRGCAKEAAKKYPELPRMVGDHIKQNGNEVFLWTRHVNGKDPEAITKLLIFPVKHKWMEPADPDLISRSAYHLGAFALASPETIFLLPRPGCGNGQLEWSDVKPLVEFLPDNVLVITKPEGK